MRYIAFLLGVNVGKRQVKMAILKETLESLGFERVKTLLASGNVVFETKETNKEKLKELIEEKLQQTFGFEIKIILRTHEEIHKLVQENPFKHVKLEQGIRLFVTFFLEKPDKNTQIPKQINDFQILKITDTEVYSVLTLNQKTTDAMKIWTTLFGKNITTRNWNTVVKIKET